MGADLDLEAVRQDGTSVPVDVALSPTTIDGQTAVVATVREISDQVAIDRTYQRILNAVPDPVVVAEADTGEIVEVNDQATELFGYSTAELLERDQASLHPDGEAERYRELFANQVDGQAQIRRQYPDGSDILIETATGETVPVEINAHVFDSGSEQLIAGVFRDLRQRRTQAEALEELHSATRQLMTATSREAVAQIASETARRVLGLRLNGVHLHDSVAEQLVPVAWSEAITTILDGDPEAIPAGEGLAWEAYVAGDPAAYDDVREAEGTLNDETPFRSELYFPLGDEGVLIAGSTEVGDFDATDEALGRVLAANVEAALGRVEHEQQLRAQNQRLEEFTSVVSHDLRNPLNVAIGSLDLAREEPDSDHLDTVSRAHDRMAELIDDLLALAKEGAAAAETDAVDLGAMLERCWQQVETADATLEAPSEQTIRADASRFRQFLENLFRNAVDHGPADVTVTVGDLAEGFYVADDGPGIAAEERDRLFEMGYSTAETGTGFGLAIVAEIAEAHGWSIDVTESASGGARFEVTGVEVVD